MSDIATKLTTIAENQQKVYDAGYAKGQAEGGDTDAAYQQGVTVGKQAERDRFWDSYQQGGNRTDYSNAFSGKGWTKETFNPKYDIVASQAYMIFRYTGITDIAEALNGKRCIIQTGVLQYTFNNTDFEVIDGVEFATPIINLDGTFTDSKKLREIVPTLPIDKSASRLNGFGNCYELDHVRFSGVIATDIDLKWSTKLSKASITNDDKTGVVNVLSATASGKTLTLSKTAVTNAFGSTTADEWTALIATKSNWTISLV